MSIPFPALVNGTPSDANQINSNNAAIVAQVNNINHGNMGLLGIYASDIIPVSGAGATFGGALGYTFLAPAVGVTPLTISGVGGQSADIFDVTLTSGGTKALQVTSAGNVNFGGVLNATLSLATVVGDIGFARSATAGLLLGGGSVNSGSIDWNVFNGSGWSLRNNGTPGYAPVFGGAYTNSSDANLKTNIAPISDAMTTVKALKPVSFDWKHDGSSSLGFLAQDVLAVLPALVSTDSTGSMGVNYDGMIPVVVALQQDMLAKLHAAGIAGF